jgi:two-component system response regulator GlrR
VQALISYAWPGNVRELENVVERAVVLSTNGTLEPADLKLPDQESSTPLSFQELKARVISEFERQYIRTALMQHGSITQAARAAGKNRRAFWELMRKHNIKPSGNFQDDVDVPAKSEAGCENN